MCVCFVGACESSCCSRHGEPPQCPLARTKAYQNVVSVYLPPSKGLNLHPLQYDNMLPDFWRPSPLPWPSIVAPYGKLKQRSDESWGGEPPTVAPCGKMKTQFLIIGTTAVGLAYHYD